VIEARIRVAEREGVAFVKQRHVHAVAERLREHSAEFEPAEAGAQNENVLFHGIAVYQVSYIHNGVQPLYQSARAKRAKPLNVQTQELIRRASRGLNGTWSLQLCANAYKHQLGGKPQDASAAC